MYNEITREIGIDAGHRVTYHGSKCRNLHGHRYTIQATLRGELATSGAGEGMVMDFGFLKELMMQFIDGHCDHALILWSEDPLLKVFLPDEERVTALEGVKKFGGYTGDSSICGKLYVVPFVPTAENLARHWFHLMRERVDMRTNYRAKLVKIRVWETPNSFADYACE
jgi:6-pyruvoyltetrahydropterin/6-carboxytetrahydropterin synthase